MDAYAPAWCYDGSGGSCDVDGAVRPIKSADCGHASTCGNLYLALTGQSETPFACPAGRVYDSSRAASGIDATAAAASGSDPQVFRLPVSDFLCCKDATCLVTDGAANENVPLREKYAFICPSGTAKKAAAFETDTADAYTNVTQAGCCFPRTCGDVDGEGTAFNCLKDDGLAGGAKHGYLFKTGSESVPLPDLAADITPGHYMQCCEAMTCGTAKTSTTVAGDGAFVYCTGPDTKPAAYTGSNTFPRGAPGYAYVFHFEPNNDIQPDPDGRLQAPKTERGFWDVDPGTAGVQRDGSVSLFGYVFDHTTSYASTGMCSNTSLGSLASVTTDGLLQTAFDTACCRQATCGDIDGLGTKYPCAIKSTAADTAANAATDQYFVFDYSTQSSVTRCASSSKQRRTHARAHAQLAGTRAHSI